MHKPHRQCIDCEKAGITSKLPALILTLHRADGMRVSVVKNRSGKSDPSGNYGVSLRADLARMTITD